MHEDHSCYPRNCEFNYYIYGYQVTRYGTNIYQEWMASTPMHMALYNAFKWTPPSFAHVPLLVDRSGQKLSKRNADIDLSSFKDQQGIFPSTLVNFASLLGWSHSEKSDVLSLKELEQIVCFSRSRENTIIQLLTVLPVQFKNHSGQHCRLL